jgi:hypothetical protein
MRQHATRRERLGLLIVGIGVLCVVASWYVPYGSIVGPAGILSILAGIVIITLDNRRSSMVVPWSHATLCLLSVCVSTGCLVSSIYFDSRWLAWVALVMTVGWCVCVMYLLEKQSWLRRRAQSQNPSTGPACSANSGQPLGPAALDHASREG